MSKDDAITRYNELKDKADSLKQRRDKAQGALDHLMKELAEQFNCETIKQAKAKLEKLVKEANSSSQEFEEALEKFEDEWNEVLERDKGE